MVRPHRLPLPLLGHQSPLLVPFTRLTAPAPARLDAQATALTPTGVAAASEHVGVLALLSATWVLMATPNLATATPAAPRPAGGSQAERRSASDVTADQIATAADMAAAIEAMPEEVGRATGLGLIAALRDYQDAYMADITA